MNLYEILGVSETASNREIKSAYKKLVKKYHPDVFKGDKSVAEEKIKEINEAYDTLSNPDLKASYDHSLFNDNDSEDFQDIQNTEYSDNLKENYSSTPKYEDLYKYDYYKKYTTNYYGISHKYDKKSSESSKVNNNNIFLKNKSKFIIIIGFSIILVLVMIIMLLSALQKTINNGFNQTESYAENRTDLPYIYYGMTFEEVKEILSFPDTTEINEDYGFTAYWGESYIVFDKYDIAIDFYGNDKFNTNENYNNELKFLRQIYGNNIFNTEQN